MVRPAKIDQGVQVWGRIPLEWKKRIEEVHGNISEFVREAIKEKLAREDEFLREKILKEIELFQLEIEKRRKIIGEIQQEEIQREEEEKAHLISILKAVFEGMGFDSIPSLNIRDNLRYGTDRDRLREWVQKRLEKISEATGADVEELRKLAFEHVEGFKELEDDA